MGGTGGGAQVARRLRTLLLLLGLALAAVAAPSSATSAADRVGPSVHAVSASDSLLAVVPQGPLRAARGTVGHELPSGHLALAVLPLVAAAAASLWSRLVRDRPGRALPVRAYAAAARAPPVLARRS